MKCCCFTTSTSASRELTGGNSSCDLDSDLETSRGSGGTSIAGHRPNWKAIGGCLPLRRLTFIKSLRMPTPSSAGGGMGHERRELVLRIILRPRASQTQLIGFRSSIRFPGLHSTRRAPRIVRPLPRRWRLLTQPSHPRIQRAAKSIRMHRAARRRRCDAKGPHDLNVAPRTLGSPAKCPICHSRRVRWRSASAGKSNNSW